MFISLYCLSKHKILATKDLELHGFQCNINDDNTGLIQLDVTPLRYAI